MASGCHDTHPGPVIQLTNARACTVSQVLRRQSSSRWAGAPRPARSRWHSIALACSRLAAREPHQASKILQSALAFGG